MLKMEEIQSVVVPFKNILQQHKDWKKNKHVECARKALKT